MLHKTVLVCFLLSSSITIVKSVGDQSEKPGFFSWLTKIFQPPSQTEVVKPKSGGDVAQSAHPTKTAEVILQGGAGAGDDTKLSSLSPPRKEDTISPPTITQVTGYAKTGDEVSPSEIEALVPEGGVGGTCDTTSPPQTTKDATLPSATIDMSSWADVEKEFWNHFAFKEGIKGVPLTHWRIMLVFDGYRQQKLLEMCQAAFASLGSKSSPPTMEPKKMAYRRLYFGPEVLIRREHFIHIDVLQCAENELYLTKGRRDNSVYFVKLIDSIKSLFVLDTNFSSDLDLRVNFLQVAQKVLKEEGCEW